MEAVSTRRSSFAPRAESIGTLAHVPRTRNLLGRMIARAVRAVAEEVAARRAIGQLESLSERELRDIGLTRADIGHAARDAWFAASHIYTTWR